MYRSLKNSSCCGKSSRPDLRLLKFKSTRWYSLARHFCVLSFTAVFMLMSCFQTGQIVFAASATWNGTTDANWATTTNWSATPVPGTGNTATFNNAGNSNTAITVGSIVINTILFDSANVAAYTLGPSVGSGTISINAGGAITVNSTVTTDQLINTDLILGTATGNQSFTITNNSATIGQLLTIAGDITKFAGTGTKTLTVTGSGDSLLSGAISNVDGTLALTKTGTGNLYLSNSNSHNGTTTINAGNLALLPGGAIAPNATLAFNGGVLAMAGTFTRVIGTGSTEVRWLGTNDGGFAALGGDLLIDFGGNSVRDLIGWADTSHTGGNQFTAGALILGSQIADAEVEFFDDLRLGTTNGGNREIRVVDNPVSNADRAIISGAISETSGNTWGLAKTGNGYLLLSGSNNYDGLTTVINGTLIAGANAPVSANGAFGNASSSIELGGTLFGGTSASDNLALLASGAFTIARSINVNNNNSVGTTTIGGEHTVGTSNFTGNIVLAKDVYLMAAAGGQVNFSTGIISGAHNVTITGGGVVNLGGVNTFGGSGKSLVIEDGTTLIASTGANGGNTNIGGNNTALTFDNGILRFGSAFDPSGRVVTLANGGATFDTNGNNVAFANAIGNSGAGALTKIGSGILQLAASNSYSGDTTISVGTLALAAASNNNIADSPSVSISSGAFLDVIGLSGSTFALGASVVQTLSGNGTVTGNLSVAANSIVSPGNSVGVLTVTGNTILSSGALFDFELATPGTSDQVIVQGGLVLSSQTFSDFNFTPLTGFGPGTYVLFAASSPWSGTFTSSSGVIDGYNATLTTSGNDLVLTVVPEPSSLVLLALGAFWWARRRRVLVA